MVNEMAYDDYHEVIGWELRAAVRRYYDKWEEVLNMDEQDRKAWISAVEQSRVSIVVLATALAEYVINFYICTRCDAKEFRDLDRRSLQQKWTEVPKQFLRKYSLAGKPELRRDLSQLIARRKAIVHPKPTMSIDGDNRHKGNEPKTELDEHDFVGRCTTLPFRLIEHLLEYDHNDFIPMHHLRICCGTVANAFETGQRRLDVAAKYPRELIREIMDQGFDRDTAVHCAILMGDKPKTDADGNIVIRHGKVITLRPLKFFAEKNKRSE